MDLQRKVLSEKKIKPVPKGYTLYDLTDITVLRRKDYRNGDRGYGKKWAWLWQEVGVAIIGKWAWVKDALGTQRRGLLPDLKRNIFQGEELSE